MKTEESIKAKSNLFSNQLNCRAEFFLVLPSGKRLQFAMAQLSQLSSWFTYSKVMDHRINMRTFNSYPVGGWAMLSHLALWKIVDLPMNKIVAFP